MSSAARVFPLRAFHHGNLRQGLINAALCAPDIEGLSLRQLAAGLGVSPAAAYRHFGSRDDLLFEVARIGFARLRERFEDAFDISVPPSSAKEARQRLFRLAQAYLQFADDEPAVWRLIFGAQAEVYRNTAHPEAGPNSYEFLPAALMGLYQHGVVNTQPDEHAALFAWSAVHGVATLRCGRVPGALISISELAELVAKRVIKALND
ncbi:MAG: TetR/AcrR family transcriptional regulator [Burkholderiaceae bacterium]|jgi:AcrR family transcriptional regulator|nr:TetR/AcrR family transcriptional regulator [Burkholderiaceae bacterium]